MINTEKCSQCGAPRIGDNCSYCGSVFKEKHYDEEINYEDIKQQVIYEESIETQPKETDFVDKSLPNKNKYIFILLQLFFPLIGFGYVYLKQYKKTTIRIILFLIGKYIPFFRPVIACLFMLFLVSDFVRLFNGYFERIIGAKGLEIEEWI